MTNTDFSFPSLNTERLHLRQLTDGDIDFVFRHYSSPKVTEYLMDEPPVAHVSEAQAMIDFYKDPTSKSRNRWGIVLKSTDQLIGTIGYHKWVRQYSRAEIGVDLAPEFWGQGIMVEAMRTAIRFGFASMELNRIDALVYVENVRCLKLMQKFGFATEGRLRDYFKLYDNFYDHYLLSLLKREWKG